MECLQEWFPKKKVNFNNFQKKSRNEIEYYGYLTIIVSITTTDTLHLSFVRYLYEAGNSQNLFIYILN